MRARGGNVLDIFAAQPCRRAPFAIASASRRRRARPVVESAVLRLSRRFRERRARAWRRVDGASGNTYRLAWLQVVEFSVKPRCSVERVRLRDQAEQPEDAGAIQKWLRSARQQIRVVAAPRPRGVTRHC
jgi:hypothetical protein